VSKVEEDSMMNGESGYWRAAVAVVVAAVTLMGAAMVPSAGAHDERRPSAFPLDASPNGNTYGEWSARWWQWLLAIPTPKNPNLDSTGENCGEGQTGPVWFLAGAFVGGFPFTRSCTVPAGKALLLPLNNTLFGAGAFDCTPTVPDVLCDLNVVRRAAADQVDFSGRVDAVKLEVDGFPIRNLNDFRVQSPVMSLTYPPDNVVSFLFGVPVPGGTYTPNVSDGYFLIFAPLPRGQHTIRIKVIGVGVGTYHLTVASPTQNAP
jgi:hypothetical protein